MIRSVFPPIHIEILFGIIGNLKFDFYIIVGMFMKKFLAMTSVYFLITATECLVSTFK